MCFEISEFYEGAKRLKWNLDFTSKTEGKYNTEYPNLPAFHSTLYNMLASSMLRKEHPYEKIKKIDTGFVLK